MIIEAAIIANNLHAIRSKYKSYNWFEFRMEFRSMLFLFQYFSFLLLAKLSFLLICSLE